MSSISDPNVIAIVSMGYSEEQAKQALAKNKGNVDDTIDYLFSKGRTGTRKKSTSPPAFSVDDMTVTDPLPPAETASVASYPHAAPSFSLMAIMDTNQNARVDETPASILMPIQEGKERAHATRPSSAKAASESNRVMNVGPEPILKSPTPSFVPEEKVWGEKNKEFNPVGTDVRSSNRSSFLGESAGARRETTTTQQTRDAMTPQPTMNRPGAFRVGYSEVSDDNDNNSLATGSTQPTLPKIMTAELVNPDEENQILERRLEEQLERERNRAAVAQVVDESELKTCRWKRVACVIGAVVVAFVVALSVSLTTQDSRNEPTPETAAPTPTPIPPPPEILELLAGVSFDGGESLMDPWSPQSAAASWLAYENDHLDTYTDQRKVQRYALATLYYSTNGDEWNERQKWLTDSNECTDWWVTEFESEMNMLNCDGNNAITRLYIVDNNLVGTLPEEIALLSDSLNELKLPGNALQGTLSPNIGLMTRLKLLSLYDNDMGGHIPTEFGLMTALINLSLYENMLSGSIPTELALLSSLERLQLQRNNLVGTLASTIGSLTLLSELILAENKFASFIPSEIGLMTSLRDFELEMNNFTGSLPTELGVLKALETIRFDENFLSGILPTELGCLGVLKYLRVAGNGITGSIPTEYSKLTTLEQLRLEYNKISGTILSSIGTFSNMNRLELKYNRLTGTIPESLGQLTLMEHLRLQNNSLTGTISESFARFRQAKFLGFSNNSLTGTLPPFVNATRLKYFKAGFNMLTGPIPTSIAQLSKLEELLLSNNNLTGTIPSLDHLQNLEIVELYNNSFVGNFTCPEKVFDCYVSCFVPNNAACSSLNS